MPIPIRELEDKARPLEERLIEFLEARPDQGFSEAEIYAAMRGVQVTSAMLVLGLIVSFDARGRAVLAPPVPEVVALKALAEAGKIRRFDLEGVSYYGAIRRG